jgi:hypothetical protein
MACSRVGFTLPFTVRKAQGNITALVIANNKNVELYNAAQFSREIL